MKNSHFYNLLVKDDSSTKNPAFGFAGAKDENCI